MYYIDEYIFCLEDKGFIVIHWKEMLTLKVIIENPIDIDQESLKLIALGIKPEVENGKIYGIGKFKALEIYYVAGFIKRNINKSAKITIVYETEYECDCE